MATKKSKKLARLASHVRRVYVGMSGGVDSSVAAALLNRQGFDVVGVFMKPWQPKGLKCMWEKDREDAMRAASQIGIPLLTWDFSKEYGDSVAQYMIDSYRKGITPNPDVMCNKEIKFGIFFEHAMKAGADYIATGHYAQTKNGKLLCAVDSNKDQTYFLWALKQEQLAKTLFPIGGYTKPEVRKLAKKFDLPNHDKKDSQGVCFVGPLDMHDFLSRYIEQKPGRIIDKRGRVLGQHDGIYYYTLGQRHGLDIKLGGGPYFVVSKELKKNIIVVGTEEDLMSDSAQVSDISWTDKAPKFPATVGVKIRYRTPAQKAVLKKDGTLKFAKHQRAITPGQSAVFYKGKTILGGGVIV